MQAGEQVRVVAPVPGLELKATARGGPVRCAYCHDESGSFQTCPGCGTSLHAWCRLRLQRCPTLGCVHGRTQVRRPPRVDEDRPWLRWMRPRPVEGGVALVFVLLVFLVTVLHSGVVGQMPAARQTKVEADLEALQNAAMRFRTNTRRWPTSGEELVSPPHDVVERWRGPYLLEELARDPWGNPYRLCPGNPPVILCLGADGLAGGTEADADTVRLVSGEQSPE